MAAATAAARVPLETFAARAAIGQPKISPDGKRIATPIWKTNEDSVLIYDVNPSSVKPISIPVPEDVEVDWVECANDNRLLIGLGKQGKVLFFGTTINARTSRIVAIDRDGKNMAVMFSHDSRFIGHFNLSQVAHPLPDQPNAVLMAAYREGRYGLFKLDVTTGKAELAERGTQNTFRWLTDLKGVPRARWEYRERQDRIELWLRKGDTDDWEKVAQYGERELPEINIIGFGDDPTTAIVASRQSSDRYGIYEYDMVAHKLGKPLFVHDRVDIGDPVGGPIYDPLTTKLIGVYYVEDVWRRHYSDPVLSRIQDKLDTTFPGATVTRFHSWSNDRNAVRKRPSHRQEEPRSERQPLSRRRL